MHPLKKGLQEVDLLPLYNYIHIDLRNDWFTRRISPGSPAGGDLATWWTSKEDLGQILTAKIKINDQSHFDWTVNWIKLNLINFQQISDSIVDLELSLTGYSPYFETFALRQDKGEWMLSEDGIYKMRLLPGIHLIEAKIVTDSNNMGPIYQADYNFNLPLYQSQYNRDSISK